ncbi:short-chain dehydrogenase/reductase [Streptomyces sp. NPDC050732]|uniref:short-chain dehydrogenase/reductase n=1 Tax=Streptomyces sp. NPDC050732 TaxID=3154632 RepID=UPI00341F9FC4
MRDSDSPLRGRTVVVTGAARGLGAALACELARRHARVALLGHERAALAAVAGALPGPALALEVDITDPAALHTAAETVRARLGRPSVVVANAGIAQAGPIETADPASWRRVIDVNLTGSAFTAQAFLPDLLHTRGYHLQIASTAALGAVPLLSAYCASKAGAEAFAHALRAETAHRGVAVGIAYLNWTGTEMIRDIHTHPALRAPRLLLPPPARRILPTDQVAARLARAVEQRRTAVYIPAWARLAQAGRAGLPPLVTRLARARFTRRQPGLPRTQTGLLGPGGLADQAARRDTPRP